MNLQFLGTSDNCAISKLPLNVHRQHLQAPTSSTTSSLRSPALKMRPVPASAGSALRNWTRYSLPTSSPSSQSSRLAAGAVATSTASTSSSQRRLQSSDAASSSFESPFRNKNVNTYKIPSFKAYASPGTEISNRVFQYFMAGSMGLLTAAAAKNTVQGM